MDNSGEFLNQVGLFSLLNLEEINSIINYLHLTEIEKKKTLFKQGDEGKELFIVKSGKVAISIKLLDGKEREIAEFKPGDFFGEMSIFENAPRSATCYTKEKSSLFTLHERDFFELIESHPFVAIKIMYRMLNITTQRLRGTSEFVADMVSWGEEARKRAITDPLTGVYNRRFLDDALADYFETSKKSGKPFSLVMVDLDHFREINELYSHKTGDLVILGVLEVFKRYLRQKDIIARYGGDEFTIILPETRLEEARIIAENICNEVSQMNLLKEFKGSITRITTSQGIASFPNNAQDLKTLRGKADQALYSAKTQGRNRVVCAE